MCRRGEGTLNPNSPDLTPPKHVISFRLVSFVLCPPPTPSLSLLLLLLLLPVLPLYPLLSQHSRSHCVACRSHNSTDGYFHSCYLVNDFQGWRRGGRGEKREEGSSERDIMRHSEPTRAINPPPTLPAFSPLRTAHSAHSR